MLQDGFEGGVENSGSDVSFEPDLSIEDGQVMNGSLQCRGTTADKCAQTDESAFFEPCLAASELTLEARLRSAPV